MVLKIVKVNEREETVRKPKKYGYGYEETKQKAHDLEIHHEDGYPVFSVRKKDYGKGYKFDWHPAMLEEHPHLKNSFEHGFGHHNRDHMTADSKDSLQYTAETHFENATRMGFKDKVPYSTRSHALEGGGVRVVHTFHDPDDGTPTVIHDSHPREGQSSTKWTKEFADKHGLNDELAQNAHAKATGSGLTKAYHFALQLKNLKDNKPKALGVVRSHDGNKAHSAVYKAAPGVSDEELSTHHENSLKTRLGDRVSITRHSPTAFSATEKGRGYNDKESATHHSSTVLDGQLFHHQFEHQQTYPSESGKLSSSF